MQVSSNRRMSSTWTNKTRIKRTLEAIVTTVNPVNSGIYGMNAKIIIEYYSNLMNLKTLVMHWNEEATSMKLRWSEIKQFESMQYKKNYPNSSLYRLLKALYFSAYCKISN